ncbi:YgaP family membrane protein [Salibacterium aidingense]|uniref:YgaP family membrane protein n=1 Tax=Salibacterium aidingense TaxID=384933 RepID=UPI00047AB28D|nr:DUF2892 domain-containing protein [Salibacterium aidingense]
MRPNIGIVNALLRITCGLTLICWANARASRMRWNGGNHLLCTVLGAMKVAEGITRFCPMTKGIQAMVNEQHHAENTPDYHNMNQT